MKVFLLDNHDSFTYNLVQLVEEIIHQPIKVAIRDQINLSDLSEFDKIILSPGPGLPKEHPLLIPIIKEYAATKSILGVCLGHQAIAYAYGGELKNLQEIRHGIAKNITIVKNDASLFKGFDSNVKVGLYNSWVIDAEQLPNELEITSIDDEDNIMSLKHTQYDVRGIQFHPESILTPRGKEIMTNWLKS